VVMLGQVKTSQRGFSLLSFEDTHGRKCHVKQSSASGEKPAGHSFLWLGVGDEAMHISRDQVIGLIGRLQSWVDTGEFGAQE